MYTTTKKCHNCNIEIIIKNVRTAQKGEESFGYLTNYKLSSRLCASSSKVQTDADGSVFSVSTLVHKLCNPQPSQLKHFSFVSYRSRPEYEFSAFCVQQAESISDNRTFFILCCIGHFVKENSIPSTARIKLLIFLKAYFCNYVHGNTLLNLKFDASRSSQLAVNFLHLQRFLPVEKLSLYHICY